MRRSTERILTTHAGSLIRPAPLLQFIGARQRRQPYDEQAYQDCLRNSVSEIVGRQASIGIDAPSDGEFGKSISWSQYALERLSGFGGRPGEAGLKAAGAVEGFLPVAAPASVIPDRRNEYYASDADCLHAIADAMRVEYRAIVDAGLLLQLDDARLAVTYDRMVPPAKFDDYRRWVALHVEALNHALEGVPEDRVRYHVCWGSWPGPHTSDVALRDIVDLILSVRAGAYLIEAANPRHEHEWRVWEDVRLPHGKVLVPGVISHATNIVEHPDLVAERIVRFAGVLGRENVIAGTDCGFAQGPFHRRVHPSIMWAKLEALVQGARLASRELWK